MPEYDIRIIRRGDPFVAVERYTGTKREARERAVWLARVAFPEARHRWSMDARMAFDDDGQHLGDVAVEPAAMPD